MCGSSRIQAWILEYYIFELDFGEDYLEGAPRKTRVKVGKLDQLKWANAFGGGRAAVTGQKSTVYCCITNAGALLLCIALSPRGRRNWRRAREWLAQRGSPGQGLQPLSPLFHRLRSLAYKYRLQKVQCQQMQETPMPMPIHQLENFCWNATPPHHRYALNISFFCND